MIGRVTTSLALCALIGVSSPAFAQRANPRATLSGGYGFLHESGTGSASSVDYDKGWVASVGVPLGRHAFSAVIEAGGQYRTTSVIESQSLYRGLAGVRVPVVRFGGASNVFVQVLGGFERFSAPGFSESGLAVQPGGGVDWQFASRLGLRAQADARFAREEGVTFKEVRAAVSLVYSVGRQ